MSADPLFPNGASCPIPALPPPVKVGMVTPPPRACSYLPDRQTTLRAFYISRLPSDLYHDFLDAGFRRAGRIVYQPICQGCRACMPIRVSVPEFAENKSLRRCRKRNADLKVSIAPPRLTDEKFDLYRRYLAERHARKLPADEGEPEENKESLDEFLYQSPVDTLEFVYRDSTGRLVAVGICDICSRSISSVYFYFDPSDSRRGLGNFGALTEIDCARQLKIPWWYLGYWVKGCRAMEYKADFHPHELLHPDGVWRGEAKGV
jgi:leucyl-tRNA---protein transferase